MRKFKFGIWHFFEYLERSRKLNILLHNKFKEQNRIEIKTQEKEVILQHIKGSSLHNKFKEKNPHHNWMKNKHSIFLYQICEI
jgi:hypothetical protein